MLLAPHGIALVSACLACLARGRRMQLLPDSSQSYPFVEDHKHLLSSPSSSLAALLKSFSPSATFKPSGPGVRFLAGSAILKGNSPNYAARRGVHGLMAEGGPPKIDWQNATVISNKVLARGTMQLRVQAGTEVGYKAGHIIGLEFDHPETGEGLKGPYTITRASTDTFDVIYRVVLDGRKTPFMEQLGPGNSVRFGGRFGTPVADGIAAEGVDRVVGVATGTGLGPLLGFAEEALTSSSSQPPHIELYCAFRELPDVFHEGCTRLAQKYPEKFKWTPIISGPVADSDSSFAQGRLSRVVPGMVGEVNGLTHFHLVGNGAFVADFKEGLLKAGIAEERVTTEKYFNGKAEPDADVVDFIADNLKVVDEPAGVAA